MKILFFVTLFLLFTGCTRFEALNATVPLWGYTRTADQPYGSLPRQKLDVYRPHNAAPGAGIVVFFYGGDWQNGAKGDYRFVAEALASQGFIAVLPDYRLYPEVRFPAFVEDGAKAIRWVHDNAQQIGGDARNIFVMGHSAGAHIAALLTLDERYLTSVGLDRSAIRAAAVLSGPYDFIPSPGDRPVFGMQQDETTTDPNMEPAHFVDGKAAPLLVVQGMRDQIVDPAQAAKLVEKIRAAGGEAKLVMYPDREHADVVLSFASLFRGLAPVCCKMSEFFREHAQK